MESLEQKTHNEFRDKVALRLENTGLYDAVMIEVPFFHPGTTNIAGVMDICAVKHDEERGYTFLHYYEVKAGFNNHRSRKCANDQYRSFINAMSPFSYIRPEFIYVGRDGVSRFSKLKTPR